ncbi:molybdate ABC transporter substrate-binding protein [Salinicola rhizosphaerae]|uniref:Molybdate ABC transporter substrate-binding protein n=1 Tax=Salinicola rhizosphaerae TaxID=1443141 RepID=A0ABQ3DP09_9GAMM|nr:molybdate ABC transporter substrate-binding protein [Salinicola rhizosphaerae]GHB09982.1 molybdate ABC transporter substrate-binding protein [Salinicola rhizosphaerae]
MSQSVRKVSLGSLVLAVILTPLAAQAADQVQVYAAASMTDAMNAAIASYEKSHDVDIVPVYASSSTLARQIANGAPADVYISANEKWMDWLEDQDAPVSERADLLKNRLVLIAPKESQIPDFTPGGDTKIVSQLGDDGRLSVGETSHVPAGIYAKQALESIGEWDALQPRLANGDNVRAAMALVERGEAPLGIVYETDAMASQKVHEVGVFPDDSHKPIVYPLAVLNPDPSDSTEAFRRWLDGDDALSIFSKFGFTPVDAD